MTLTELANKYGTDKGTTVGAAHGYTEIYERYLEPIRQTAKKVLEIGIAGGASLKMWREYFPNAVIYGIDHNVEYYAAMGGVDPMIQPDLGVASDPKMWERFKRVWGGEFDVCIDDGGHFSSQIIPAFEGAWPLLRVGGLYLCEDLHQVFLQEKGAKETVFDYFAGYMSTALHEEGADQCGKPSVSCVEFMHWYKSLLIIKRR